MIFDLTWWQATIVAVVAACWTVLGLERAGLWTLPDGVRTALLIVGSFGAGAVMFLRPTRHQDGAGAGGVDDLSPSDVPTYDDTDHEELDDDADDTDLDASTADDDLAAFRERSDSLRRRLRGLEERGRGGD